MSLRGPIDWDAVKARDREPRRWKVWWQFGFPIVIRFISALPIAEWRQESWIWHVDVWAMKHIGRG